MDCIKATQIPHSPKNLLEEIICDADLHHLGMKDIEDRGELLRQEYELKGIKKLSDVEWLRNSLEFFNKHQYFTDYAKREFGIQKNLNQLIMERKLKKIEKRWKEEQLTDLKLKVEQDENLTKSINQQNVRIVVLKLCSGISCVHMLNLVRWQTVKQIL